MTAKRSLSKIPVVGRDDHLYLMCTLWDNGHSGIDILLTNAENAWTSSVSEEELSLMADKMKMSYEEFIEETLKALTRCNLGQLQFEYHLKELNDNEYRFTWKKYLAKEKIRIQLGQIKLMLKDEETDILREIIDHSIDEKVKLDENIKSLQSDNQRLSDERAVALKRLDIAVSAKEEIETQLYSKFVLVVNDKKKKIRELQRDMKELKSSQQSNNSTQSVAVASRTQEPARRKSTSDGESDDEGSGQEQASDYHTDEEKDGVSVTSAEPLQKKAKTKTGATSLFDTSDDLGLNIEDNDSPVTAKNTRRRGRRGGGTTGKKTPSKAIIPKVPSSKTPASLRKKTSLRKSTTEVSNTSRRSSDASFDDLLENL